MKFVIAGKTVEVKDEVLSKALEDKTAELPIEADFVIRTPEEETQFVTNTRNEQKKVGVEMAVKEAREKLGLSFTGKTIDNLLTAATAKALEDANLNPDEQVKKAKDDLALVTNENIRLKGEVETATKKYASTINDFKIDKEIDSLIPEKTTIPREDMKLILKNKLSFEVDENGKIVVKDQTGEIIKDPATAAARPVKDIVTDFFQTNKHYVGSPGGGGSGKDSDPGSGGAKIKVADFIKEMQEAGVAPNSPEFTAKLEAKTAAGEIDME